MTGIALHRIRTDGGTQPRAELSADIISEYWEAMQRGDMFPPIKLTYDGQSYWLTDGFHRVAAAKRLSLLNIDADVTSGTLQDAQWRSLSVNQTHGLRRTTADKQRAIEAALRHPNGAGKSDRSIAEYLGVDHKTVAKVRIELAVSGEIPQIGNREVVRNGTTYTQNTAGINASRPAPVRYTNDEFSQADPDIDYSMDPEGYDEDAIQIDDAIDEITYDETGPDDTAPEFVDNPSGSPYKTLAILDYTSAFCDKCGQSRTWKLTERIGVNLVGVCQECRTVALRTPHQWSDARAGDIQSEAALIPDGAIPYAVVSPRTWPADLPVYCLMCKTHHAEWRSVGDAWLCIRCRDIRLNDTMPDPNPNTDDSPIPPRKWNPGIRVMCDGCNEPHADWIARPGDGWICRKCGVIRGNDTMEEWTPADRHTPNYVSPNAPRVNNSAAVANMLSSNSNEWYTPSVYIEAARLVMGSIDLDPASCALANETVMADRYFDQAMDGLSREWRGCVWLNPPYGKNDDNDSNQGLWTQYLINMYQAGCIEQAVLLVNAAPERTWFKPLFDYPVCFTDHRIKFYNATGVSNNSTIGNAFVYFGPYISRFIQHFNQFGTVVQAVRS